MGISLPNGLQTTSAQLIVDRYNEIIDELKLEQIRAFIDYLNYDFLTYSNRFQLQHKPAPNSIRLFINGIVYTEASNTFTFNPETQTLEWVFTAEHGGFDLKSTWNYMAIYDYYLIDNGFYDNIEKVLNALILINPDLMRWDDVSDTQEKEKELCNYISQQISKGNLSYKAIQQNYPDLIPTINKTIANFDKNSRQIQNALNMMLLINPKLLYIDTIHPDISRELIVDYIKQQISKGVMTKEEIISRYPDFLDLL